jgi:hypothetical protein
MANLVTSLGCLSATTRTERSRKRMCEFLGGPDLQKATAVYTTRTDGFPDYCARHLLTVCPNTCEPASRWTVRSGIEIPRSWISTSNTIEHITGRINAPRLARNQNHTGTRLDKITPGILELCFFSRGVETGWRRFSSIGGEAPGT